jgi:hypothetical protein
LPLRDPATSSPPAINHTVAPFVGFAPSTPAHRKSGAPGTVGESSHQKKCVRRNVPPPAGLFLTQTLRRTTFSGRGLDGFASVTPSIHTHHTPFLHGLRFPWSRLGISGIFQPANPMEGSFWAQARTRSFPFSASIGGSNVIPLPFRNPAASSPHPINPTVAPLVGFAPSTPTHTKSDAPETVDDSSHQKKRVRRNVAPPPEEVCVMVDRDIMCGC